MFPMSPVLSALWLPVAAALALQVPSASAGATAAPRGTAPGTAQGATPGAAQSPAQSTEATRPTPVTVESLLPASAVMVVRASSLERLEGNLRTFAQLEGEDAAVPELLPMLGGALGADAPWELVDKKRPLALAVSISEIRPPAAMTLIVHTTDAAKFVASENLQAAGWKCKAHGDLVVMAMEPSDATLADDAPLRGGLERHDLVVRTDVEEIMAQYGDLFRQGFESSMQDRLMGARNEDERAMLQDVFDGTLEVIEKIETFGMTLDGTANRMSMGFELTSMPESPLLKVEKVDTKPLAGLLAAIAPDAPIAAVSAMNFAGFMKALEPLIEMGAKQAAQQGANAEARQLLDTLRVSREAYEAMGPLMAMGMRMDGEGMAITYALRPADPVKCTDALLNLFRSPILKMKVDGPTESTIAGHAVRSARVRIEAPADLGMGSTSENPAAMQAAMAEAMTKMFGSDALPFAFVPHEGSLLVTLGSAQKLEASIQRFAAGAPSAAGADVLRALGAMNPGFAMRVAPEPLLDGVSAFAVRMGGEPMPMNDEIRAALKACPPAYVTLGLQARTWRMAMEMDVVSITKLVRAFQAEERRRDPSALQLDVRAEMWDVQYGLADYATNNGGQYPDDVTILGKKDSNGEAYVDDADQLIDPWNRPYRFDRPAEEGALPRVYTLGKDGVPGGQGEDADISTDVPAADESPR